MSVEEVTFYRVICDCCGEPCDYGDYSAMNNADDAVEQIEDAYWRTIDGDHLCNDCWMYPYQAVDYDEDEFEGEEDEPIRRHETHHGADTLVMVCHKAHPETGEECVVSGAHTIHSLNVEDGPDWTDEVSGAVA